MSAGVQKIPWRQTTSIAVGGCLRVLPHRARRKFVSPGYETNLRISPD